MYNDWIKNKLNKLTEKFAVNRFALFVAGAMVWWMILYPELSFIDGTYQLVLTDADGQVIVQGNVIDDAAGQVIMQRNVIDDTDEKKVTTVSDDDVLKGLLKAGNDEIVIESKLFTWLFKKQ